jgi:hypothetical protein
MFVLKFIQPILEYKYNKSEDSEFLLSIFTAI